MICNEETVSDEENILKKMTSTLREQLDINSEEFNVYIKIIYSYIVKNDFNQNPHRLCINCRFLTSRHYM